jgi:hypothetical protein
MVNRVVDPAHQRPLGEGDPAVQNEQALVDRDDEEEENEQESSSQQTGQSGSTTEGTTPTSLDLGKVETNPVAIARTTDPTPAVDTVGTITGLAVSEGTTPSAPRDFNLPTTKKGMVNRVVDPAHQRPLGEGDPAVQNEQALVDRDDEEEENEQESSSQQTGQSGSTTEGTTPTSLDLGKVETNPVAIARTTDPTPAVDTVGTITGLAVSEGTTPSAPRDFNLPTTKKGMVNRVADPAHQTPLGEGDPAVQNEQVLVDRDDEEEENEQESSSQQTGQSGSTTEGTTPTSLDLGKVETNPVSIARTTDPTPAVDTVGTITGLAVSEGTTPSAPRDFNLPTTKKGMVNRVVDPAHQRPLGEGDPAVQNEQALVDRDDEEEENEQESSSQQTGQSGSTTEGTTPTSLDLGKVETNPVAIARTTDPTPAVDTVGTVTGLAVSEGTTPSAPRDFNLPTTKKSLFNRLKGLTTSRDLPRKKSLEYYADNGDDTLTEDKDAWSSYLSTLTHSLKKTNTDLAEDATETAHKKKRDSQAE